MVRAALGLRGGLELELFWASTLGIRTEESLGLLLDLENLIGLLHLHAIHHVWPYAYLSCPHLPPLLERKAVLGANCT